MKKIELMVNEEELKKVMAYMDADDLLYTIKRDLAYLEANNKNYTKKQYQIIYGIKALFDNVTKA